MKMTCRQALATAAIARRVSPPGRAYLKRPGAGRRVKRPETGGVQVPIPTAPSNVPGPVPGNTMTNAYAQLVGRMAYVWGYAMVNAHTRGAAFSEAPEPGYLGGRRLRLPYRRFRRPRTGVGLAPTIHLATLSMPTIGRIAWRTLPPPSVHSVTSGASSSISSLMSPPVMAAKHRSVASRLLTRSVSNPGAPRLNVLAGAVGGLPDRGFGPFDRFTDLGVTEVEHLLEHEYGPLCCPDQPSGTAMSRRSSMRSSREANASRVVRAARSEIREWSKPKSAERVRSSSGSTKWAGSWAAPARTPATDPAVAPLESVSQPPWTVSPTVAAKSPSPQSRPAAIMPRC